MEVIPYADFTVKQFVNPFKASNTFLIEPSENHDVWLIDIGDTDELLAEISGKTVKGIVLTHAHFDHIKGLKALYEKHAECVLYGSKQCLDWVYDDKRNLSFYYEQPLCIPEITTIPLDNGDIVSISPNLDLKAISTPGHSEDSMSYLFSSFLATGDAYIPNVPPVTKLKGGNKTQYQESLKIIKSYITSQTILLPGHGVTYKGSELIDNI